MTLTPQELHELSLCEADCPLCKAEWEEYNEAWRQRRRLADVDAGVYEIGTEVGEIRPPNKVKE